MKFINREFATEKNPAILADESVCENGKAVFPVRPTVGAGLDVKVPNGVLLAGELGTVWGLKFSYFKGGRFLTDEDFVEEPTRYLAAGVNAKFRYICHNDLTVSIVRYSKNALVMSLSALNRTKMRLSFYSLTHYDSGLRLSGNNMLGVANERAVIPGDIISTDDGMVARGRYEVIYDENSARKEYAVASVVTGTGGVFDVKDSVIEYETTLDSANPRVIVYIAIGDENVDANIPTLEELNRGVNNAELSFSAEKVIGSGSLAEYTGDIYSSVLIHRFYNPLRLSTYYAEDRKKTGTEYALDSTEAEAAVLAGVLIGDTNLDQLVCFCDDVILGAIVPWIAFCRTRNKEILSRCLPKWIAKWGINTTLVTVDPISKREIAYKMADSPIKEINPQLLYSLDYNAYKLLALEVMKKSACVLGNGNRMKLIKAEKEFSDKFTSTFFNPKLGLFMDRYSTGEFSKYFGALSLLPLITSAVKTNDLLDMLLINLNDESKLGGRYPVPTLSKDNFSYGKKLKQLDGAQRNPYEDYTGSVIAYLNYLIYQGLVRYGACEARAELALASVEQWKRYFVQYGKVPSIFLPNGKFDKKATVDACSGNLMGLLGVSELLDVEYFRNDLRPSIRFGTLVEGDQRIANIELFNRKFALTIVDKTTTLFIDDKKAIEGIGGAFVVRNLIEKPKGLEFMVYAKSSLTFTVVCPVLIKAKGEPSVFRFNMDEGKFLVTIENDRVKLKRIVRNK